MVTIGITGGIGSGKSYVVKKLEQRGIACYNCDYHAKQLNNTDTDIINALTHRYGKQAYINGELNRPFIAQKIFTNKTELQWMNNLVHPKVQQHFMLWQKQQKSEIVAIESAILFNGNLYSYCNKVIVVDAPLKTRIKRVVERDNTTPEQVEQRIKNQTDTTTMLSMADYVIFNDEKHDIDEQIDFILQEIMNNGNI